MPLKIETYKSFLIYFILILSVSSCVSQKDLPTFKAFESINYTTLKNDSIRIDTKAILNNPNLLRFNVADIKLNVKISDFDFPVTVNFNESITFKGKVVAVPLYFDVSEQFLKKNAVDIALNALFLKKIGFEFYGKVKIRKSLISKTVPFREEINLEW